MGFDCLTRNLGTWLFVKWNKIISGEVDAPPVVYDICHGREIGERYEIILVIENKGPIRRRIARHGACEGGPHEYEDHGHSDTRHGEPGTEPSPRRKVSRDPVSRRHGGPALKKDGEERVVRNGAGMHGASDICRKGFPREEGQNGLSTFPDDLQEK